MLLHEHSSVTEHHSPPSQASMPLRCSSICPKCHYSALLYITASSCRLPQSCRCTSAQTQIRAYKQTDTFAITSSHKYTHFAFLFSLSLFYCADPALPMSASGHFIFIRTKNNNKKQRLSPLHQHWAYVQRPIAACITLYITLHYIQTSTFSFFSFSVVVSFTRSTNKQLKPHALYLLFFLLCSVFPSFCLLAGTPTSSRPLELPIPL